MLQRPWQLGDVSGDAPGLVAGEEVRRAAAVGVADDEAPPIQLGVGLLDGPGRRQRRDISAKPKPAR